MSTASDPLWEQALALPSEDRAKLAWGLLASLDQGQDDEAERERLWSEETERRAATIATGEVEPVTWDHLTERIDRQRPPSPAE